MMYKLLNFLHKMIDNSKEPVYIFSDGSGKWCIAAIVVIDRGALKYIRYTDTAPNSALSECAGLKIALLLSKMYVNMGRKVHVRLDNQGVIGAYNRAKQHMNSGAPIHGRLRAFINEEMEDIDLNMIKVRWCKGHQGMSGNEVADWLTRYENLDNINKFDYFDMVDWK